MDARAASGSNSEVMHVLGVIGIATTRGNGTAEPSRESLGTRATRIAILTLTGVILVFAALNLWATAGTFGARGQIGLDIAQLYTGSARHWLATGEMYAPEQLAGPYRITDITGMYFPPVAMYLFVAFLILPVPLWWVIPAVAYVACFRRFRPAIWTYPVLALIAWWPRTAGQIVVGGSDLWVGAGVAAGLLLGWPYALIAIKPSYIPLALLGMRRRSWWIAATLILLAALPFGDQWLKYIDAIRNAQLPLTYSLPQMPIVLAPAIMWLGRTRHLDQSIDGRSQARQRTEVEALIDRGLSLIRGDGLRQRP